MTSASVSVALAQALERPRSFSCKSLLAIRNCGDLVIAKKSMPKPHSSSAHELLFVIYRSIYDPLYPSVCLKFYRSIYFQPFYILPYWDCSSLLRCNALYIHACEFLFYLILL